MHQIESVNQAPVVEPADDNVCKCIHTQIDNDIRKFACKDVTLYYLRFVSQTLMDIFGAQQSWCKYVGIKIFVSPFCPSAHDEESCTFPTNLCIFATALS